MATAGSNIGMNSVHTGLEKSSGFLESSTLIHVGVELVVVGGLAFWIHRKTSDLQEQVTGLSEKVNRYEELLKRQGELLAKHENALRQVYSFLQGVPPKSGAGASGGNGLHSHPPLTQKKKVPSKRRSSRSAADGDTSVARSDIGKTFSRVVQSAPSDSESETGVDALLAEELADLDTTECDVDGGACELPKKK